MKLITTSLRYDWDKQENAEEIKSLFKVWTGSDEPMTYTQMTLTEKEYLDNYTFLNAPEFVRNISCS